jgi:hypothetical protein
MLICSQGDMQEASSPNAVPRSMTELAGNYPACLIPVQNVASECFCKNATWRHANGAARREMAQHVVSREVTGTPFFRICQSRTAGEVTFSEQHKLSSPGHERRIAIIIIKRGIPWVKHHQQGFSGPRHVYHISERTLLFGHDPSLT